MPLVPSSTRRSASPSLPAELSLSPLLPPSSLRPSLTSRSSVPRLTPLSPLPTSPSRPRSPAYGRPLIASQALALTRRRTDGPLTETRRPPLPHVRGGGRSSSSDRRRHERPERDAFSLEVRVGRFTFRPDDVLGQGSFGTVHAGREASTGRLVAIKLEPLAGASGRSHLANEVAVLHKLSGAEGMPRFRGWSIVTVPLTAPLTVSAPVSPLVSRASTPTPGARWKECAMLVTDRLGPSLDVLARNGRGQRPVLETVLRIAIQLINRAETIHGRGFIHRDLKPENVLIGLLPHDAGKLFLVDFGLAQPFKTSLGRHVDQELSGMAGTQLFMSRNASRGMQSSRRDDLESIGFIVLWLLGPLPWAGLTRHFDIAFGSGGGPPSAIAVDTVRRIEEAKTRTVHCLGDARRRSSEGDRRRDAGSVEIALGDYFALLSRLRFAERPDYSALKQIFVRCAGKNGLDASGPVFF